MSPALSNSSIQEVSASNDNFSLTEDGDGKRMPDRPEKVYLETQGESSERDANNTLTLETRKISERCTYKRSVLATHPLHNVVLRATLFTCIHSAQNILVTVWNSLFYRNAKEHSGEAQFPKCRPHVAVAESRRDLEEVFSEQRHQRRVLVVSDV